MKHYARRALTVKLPPRARTLTSMPGSVGSSAHLAGKATNRHHVTDNSVTGSYGLKLSIVIPVYNEFPSLPIILNKVVMSLPSVDKEIIVVDDCSTDGTRE